MRSCARFCALLCAVARCFKRCCALLRVACALLQLTCQSCARMSKTGTRSRGCASLKKNPAVCNDVKVDKRFERYLVQDVGLKRKSAPSTVRHIRRLLGALDIGSMCKYACHAVPFRVLMCVLLYVIMCVLLVSFWCPSGVLLCPSVSFCVLLCPSVSFWCPSVSFRCPSGLHLRA